MVVILDDREDVWQGAPNLVRVKPYVYFAGVPDVNATPLDMCVGGIGVTLFNFGFDRE
jgi:hypothetical protein